MLSWEELAYSLIFLLDIVVNLLLLSFVRIGGEDRFARKNSAKPAVLGKVAKFGYVNGRHLLPNRSILIGTVDKFYMYLFQLIFTKLLMISEH